MEPRRGRGPDWSDTLVSVVVPAYNAAETLSDTLDSVLVQTHWRLEVVVVDDGSTDATATIAQGYAARHARVRVVSTPNRGVAAARNRGAAEGTGRFIACLDADDLWHPTMIEKCLAAMAAAGPEAGFCYAFFRRIDSEARVINDGQSRVCAGFVFNRLLMNNFVGNGSGLVMRREAFEAVGGYDVGLRAQGAQGSEDWLIQSLIARRWRVAVVPEYLVGYRRGRGGMSDDTPRMHQSMLMTLRRIAAAAPEASPVLFRYAEAALRARIAVWTLRRGRAAAALASLARAALLSPSVTLAVLRYEASRRARAAGRKASAHLAPHRTAPLKPKFQDISPLQGADPAGPHFLDPWIMRFPEPARDPSRDPSRDASRRAPGVAA